MARPPFILARQTSASAPSKRMHMLPMCGHYLYYALVATCVFPCSSHEDRMRDAEKGERGKGLPKTAAQPVKQPRAMNLINRATRTLMLFMLRVLRMDHWDKSLLLNAEGHPTAKGLLSNQLTRYLLWETVSEKTPWALIVVHLRTFHFKDCAHSWILSLLLFFPPTFFIMPN